MVLYNAILLSGKLSYNIGEGANSLRGVFIVLEGAEGSGLGAQFSLLTERLKAAGYDVASYDFPRHGQGSSHFVTEYLSGSYGDTDEISPYTASLFYTMDRYAASKDIFKDLEAGKVVVASRYVGSNMAHQGAKFGDPGEQRGFFVWNDNLEFELLKLPRPDINLFLRVPADVSIKLLGKEGAGKAADHIEHLKKSIATYDLLCQLFPKDFKAVECVKDGKLLGIPAISNLLWDRIKPMLPPDKPKRGHAAVVTLGETEPAAKKYSGKDSPDRLSVPFKSASLLLRQQIEMVYPGSTVPKLGFWSDNDFDFYTPQDIPNNLKPAYKEIVSGMADKYQRLITGLQKHYAKDPAAKDLDLRSLGYLVKPVTPLAAIIPFEAVLKKSEVLPLARRLLDADLPEAQWAAKQLYLMARQVWPADFKSPLETGDTVVSIGDILAKLTPAKLSSTLNNETARLLEATPRQEFDLLAESIYPYSSLSLDEIAQEVQEWPYQQKYDALRKAAAQPSLLRKVRYKMDVISDQLSMAVLAEAAGLQHVQVQPVSPRYGFEVPQIIEDADLDDLYNECFDESLHLYSLLQSAGREDLAGYSALAGHKVRWQFNASAADIQSARPKKDASVMNLLDKLVEAAAQDHPLLWDVLTGKTGSIAAGSSGQGHARVKPYHQRQRRRGGNPKKP
jgi:dTMP kinase